MECGRLAPRLFGKLLRLLRQISYVLVGVLMTFEPSLASEFLVLGFRVPPRVSGFHQAARLQYGTAELRKLAVQKLLGVPHHHQAAQIELILEYVEQDRGQPVQFLDFGFGQIVLRCRDIGLANIVVRPDLQAHIRDAGIGPGHHDFRRRLRGDGIDQFGLRPLIEVPRGFG